jgi:hypothetical protein
VGAVHPVVAENISLKKRVELLVRLIAERQHETNMVSAEIDECDEVIQDMHRMMGANAVAEAAARASSSGADDSESW